MEIKKWSKTSKVVTYVSFLDFLAEHNYPKEVRLSLVDYKKLMQHIVVGRVSWLDMMVMGCHITVAQPMERPELLDLGGEQLFTNVV